MSDKLDDDFLDDDFLDDDILLDDDFLDDDFEDSIPETLGSDDLDDLDDDLNSAILDDDLDDDLDDGIEDDFSDPVNESQPSPGSDSSVNASDSDNDNITKTADTTADTDTTKTADTTEDTDTTKTADTTEDTDTTKTADTTEDTDSLNKSKTKVKKERSKLLTLLILFLFIMGMALLAYILLAPTPANDNAEELVSVNTSEPIKKSSEPIIKDKNESALDPVTETLTDSQPMDTNILPINITDELNGNHDTEVVPVVSNPSDSAQENISQSLIAPESSTPSNTYATNILSNYVTLDYLDEKASELHTQITKTHKDDFKDLQSKTQILVKGVSAKIIKIGNKSDKVIRKSMINKTERAFSMISSINKKISTNKKNYALNNIKFKKDLNIINTKFKTASNEQTVIIANLLTRISSLEDKIKELEISSSDNMSKLPTFELLGFDAQKMTVWLKDEFENVIKTTEGTFIPQYGIVKQITEEGIIVTNVGYVKTK